MKADIVPLLTGVIVFVSSLISFKLGLSVAIIEILFGAIAAHFGLKTEDWMIYIANFGGIILTFLAGTEIDAPLMREKFKETFAMILGSLGLFLILFFLKILSKFVGVFFLAKKHIPDGTIYATLLMSNGETDGSQP